MKKEEKSKLMKFLEYVTSKAFRDTVKNIFITLIVIGIVVLVYLFFINYSAKKIKEGTGVDLLKNSPDIININLSQISSETFVADGKLKTKIKFSTQTESMAFVKLSGKGRTINKTSESAKEHEFIFDMEEDDFNSLFVYTVIVSDSFGKEEKIMGKIMMPLKPEQESKEEKVKVVFT